MTVNLPPSTRTDQTREALLAAGTELFAELGFDGATVEAIARRAGVNKALINYHFGGKLALYQAILLDHFADSGPRVQAIQAGAGVASDRLRRALDVIRERIRRRPTLPAMILREAVSGGDHLDPSTLRFMAGMATAIQQIIAEGVESGEFRPVDPHLAYLSLLGGMIFFHGTTTFRRRLHDQGLLASEIPAPETYSDHMVDFTLRALRPTGSARRGRA